MRVLNGMIGRTVRWVTAPSQQNLFWQSMKLVIFFFSECLCLVYNQCVLVAVIKINK